MKKIFLIIILGFSFLFTGCIAETIMFAGALLDKDDPVVYQQARLERLRSNPNMQLLTEDEKIRAAKSICELKHLDKKKNNQTLQKYAKAFCKLKKGDKLYFYDWCREHEGLNSLNISYLLVRDEKAFESIQIERRYSKEERKNILIIERLH